jgi:tryptophan-rich sensory protein
MPPGAVFGIAWTILYILLGLRWRSSSTRAARGGGGSRSALRRQMLLNYSWSPVFFALHQVPHRARHHRRDARPVTSSRLSFRADPEAAGC